MNYTLSSQAIGALMMALQKCLMEETDIMPLLQNMEFFVDIKQDEDGRLYALEADREEDVVTTPLTLKIRLELEPLVQRFRAG